MQFRVHLPLTKCSKFCSYFWTKCKYKFLHTLSKLSFTTFKLYLCPKLCFSIFLAWGFLWASYIPSSKYSYFSRKEMSAHKAISTMLVCFVLKTYVGHFVDNLGFPGKLPSCAHTCNFGKEARRHNYWPLVLTTKC